jgi:hypothetical protein
MLIERIVKGVKHLVIIPKEFERDDDKKRMVQLCTKRY